MQKDLLYQIALTLIPNIGPVQARILLSHFEVADIFKAKMSSLERIKGIGRVRAQSIRRFSGFQEAEKEISFIEKNLVRTFFLTDPAYPRRLLQSYDPPILLYYQGRANLNADRALSVVGSRRYSSYGKYLADELMTALAEKEVLVISGLAFGIDAVAHRAALQHSLPTVGVLAHGLDSLYPSAHKGLAHEMLEKGGGLLSEFRSGTQPDRHNFPARNRIIAGLSDATVVIETSEKGGSMITAELANEYHKEVFAFPGRTTDTKSNGCNLLIKANKALMALNGRDIAVSMGWKEPLPAADNKPSIQAGPVDGLTAEQRSVIAILREKQSPVHIDEINEQIGMGTSMVAAIILTLELENVILSLPGKRYQLA